MNPRSPTRWLRISVPRSITFASFSKPCEKRMPSTAVGIEWKGAQHALGLHARFERRVRFRVERFGLRHAARHPQAGSCNPLSGAMFRERQRAAEPAPVSAAMVAAPDARRKCRRERPRISLFVCAP